MQGAHAPGPRLICLEDLHEPRAGAAAAQPTTKHHPAPQNNGCVSHRTRNVAKSPPAHAFLATSAAAVVKSSTVRKLKTRRPVRLKALGHVHVASVSFLPLYRPMAFGTAPSCRAQDSMAHCGAPLDKKPSERGAKDTRACCRVMRPAPCACAARCCNARSPHASLPPRITQRTK